MRRCVSILVFMISLVLTAGIVLAAASEDAKHRLLIQVSDGDPKVINMALNNAMNVVKALGQDNVDVEIIAYGPGLKLVLQKSEEFRDRVLSIQHYGVRFVACGNTMENANVSKNDLVKGVSVVQAGVVEIMEKQEQGWSYVRP